MRLRSTILPFGLRVLRPWVAWLGVWVVLGLAVTSVAPEWHAALHHDCDHAEHRCAITDWAQFGSVDLESPVLVVARHNRLLGRALELETRVWSRGGAGWAWAQGPPRV